MILAPPMESQIQADIRIALGRQALHTRLLRNSKGQGWMGSLVSRHAGRVVLENARQVAFGLIAPGSSDLLGPIRVLVTPEMVGQTVALFGAMEIKRPGGRRPQDQIDFVSFVNNFGGRAGFVESVDDALRLVSP